MDAVIKNCRGNDFYTKLDTYFDTPISIQLKNILLLNDYDSLDILKEFDDECLVDIENYMKNVFDVAMLKGDEEPEAFLGRYVNCQQKFEFTSGQKQRIKVIVKKCKEIDGTCSSVQEGTKRDKMDLFKLIGSQILSVFNDAKKITLSAWSWPSRIVADQLSSKFKKHGANYQSVELPIELLYVTPSHHNDLLDSIVTVDIQHLQNRLRKSLALSLRVDGSCDRIQKHNIHVLIHVVQDDGTLSTYFIGFDIPDGSKADSYFEVTKKIAGKILPLNELIALIISLVTDGEPMNTGNLSGLWAQLLKEKREATPNMPLIRTWCIAHRTNLSWKDMLNLKIISDLFTDASSISTHFHQSGERTRKLTAVASQNNLNAPLRYPQVFDIRWCEFTYGLLNAVLRNWRSSVTYFESEKLDGFLKRWLCYEQLHLTTFICDILRLLKSFQKQFQDDSISIAHVPMKRARLIERLRSIQNGALENGWEELFLKEIVHENGKMFLHGHELTKSSGRTRRTKSKSKFTTADRSLIIQKLIANLTERLDLDQDFQNRLNPMLKINATIHRDVLEQCHSVIIPDLPVNDFVLEYNLASELLSDDERKQPLRSIIQLEQSTL